MTTASVVAEALSCRIGGRLVVDAVSLAPRAGEWLALVGPNGAGKSSLLAMLAGVKPPSQGRLTLDGRPLAAWPPRERARRVAWLAQAGESEGELAVHDVVRLGRLPHHGLLGTRAPADDAIVAQALREMALEPLATRSLAQLSGGERQRVLLARAFAVQAGTLLLDEPTAHLDAPHQRALVRSVRARAAAGAAVVTVLHDLTLALRADRVAVLAAGRLHALGVPDDPALHRALEAAFDHAFAIMELPSPTRPAPRPDARWPRWTAVALY